MNTRRPQSLGFLPIDSATCKGMHYIRQFARASQCAMFCRQHNAGGAEATSKELRVFSAGIACGTPCIAIVSSEGKKMTLQIPSIIIDIRGGKT